MKKGAGRPTNLFFGLAESTIRDVVEAGHFEPRPRAWTGMPPHRHDAARLEIIYVKRGQLTQKINGELFTMFPGHALLILPGDFHDADDLPEERSERYFLVLRVPSKGASFLSLRGPDAGHLHQALLPPRHRHFVLSTLGRGFLHALFEELTNWQRSSDTDPLVTARIEAMVAVFMLEVARCSDKGLQDQSSPWAKNITDYIKANLTAPLHMKDLAMRAGMSIIGFQCRFKKDVGVPPSEYIARIKVETAKRLLRQSDAAITAAAFATGFSTSQHFAAFFRKHVGITPRDYRRKLGHAI